MTRRRAAAVGALLALACGLSAADAAPTRSQIFFRDKLLADAKTSDVIKDLLKDGGGFVDRGIVFRDLTGDDRDDAIVRVHSGGAMGVVAIYVFSTDAKKDGTALVAAYRQQKLTRASTRVKGRVLSFRSSAYAVGDELCCPAGVVETTLKWDKKKRAFLVAKREAILAAPEPAPTPTATP